MCPDTLTEPSCVRPDWSFGWNHDQTTDFPVLKLVFPDQLDIPRPTVEPDLAWVVKKQKMDMHSHPADHPDSPASVLIFTPCIHLVRMNLDILTSLLHFPCLDQIYSRSAIAFSDHIQNPGKVLLPDLGRIKWYQSHSTDTLTEPSRVRPDWSFGWNHDQATDFPVLKLVFPYQLDNIRPMVEPDLAWVVKKPKTDMHSHPADHLDSPASVLIFTPCIHLDIVDSTLKGIDISSCDPTSDGDREITMEDFLELEEFLELEDGEKLEDLDSSRKVTMEDFLELEE
ncbi:hypothetical protein YC2023_018423 [Brassica napus]